MRSIPELFGGPHPQPSHQEVTYEVQCRGEGLFDVGEIDFAIEMPIAPGCTVSLAVELETTGAARLTFGWTIAR